MKIHLCQDCGETDPTKFVGRMKGRCYECHKKKYKAYYRADKSSEPHFCETCGEKNPRNFYPNSKSKCKKCSGYKQLPKYVCKHCGKTGEDNFAKGLKFTCKECSKTKPKETKSKYRNMPPYVCQRCGASGAENFYSGVRFTCKACYNKQTTLCYYPFYDVLVKAQGGEFCFICKKTPKELGAWRLAVDHDHGTGLVRGLLCSWCNFNIDKFTADMAANLSTYLTEPPATALRIMFPEKAKKS